jgi:hypothetical protein
MTVLVNVLLSVAFAAAVGAAVHYWRLQFQTSRREGMQALAARRGWALTMTGERLGRAGTLRLVPRGGLPWVAETRPEGATAASAATEYEAEAPRWGDGTLVLAPAAEGAEAVPDPRAWADRALGPQAASVAPVQALRRIEAPPGMVALSDGSPTLRVDLADLAQALRDWPPVGSGPRGRPILVLSPSGLRLRVNRPIRRADQMERFLDLALELSRLIGPGV